ncbi:1,4-alpha-glucan branching enzyme, partial [Undibacterium sp. CCC2.1]|nr:1,4-alpha-glucan branching enzyme [Undibacterium sp. CCC2.1]
TQMPPETASVVATPLNHDWQDSNWMQSRGGRHSPKAPLSIYELHAGSWQLDHSDEFVVRQYNWQELGDRLIPYIKELGFT